MSARGTSNANHRGNSQSRRVRREWLVERYRANQVIVYIWREGVNTSEPPTWTQATYDGPSLVGLQQSWGRSAEWVPACRCYRCGLLLTADTLTVDRIISHAEGGTYARNNIRPACGNCNSVTGTQLRERLKIGRVIKCAEILRSGKPCNRAKGHEGRHQPLQRPKRMPLDDAEVGRLRQLVTA